MDSKFPVVLNKEDIDEKLFWSKVDRLDDNSCWKWLASIDPDGYGQFVVNGHPRSAHRAAYALAYGSIPYGLCVLHRCDNRSCVNPKHLFIGTKKDNTLDMIQKGRQIHPSMPGESNPNSNVTWNDVRAIRKEYKARLGTRRIITLTFELARHYGISIYQISNIVNNKSWIE